MRKTETPSSARRPRPAQPPGLVPIDEAPLRAKHATAAQRLLSRYASARKRLADYHQLDRPAFGRWLARTFRADLEAAEAMQTRLMRARSLAERIEAERDEARSSYYEAFQSVMEEEATGLREDAERAEEEASAEGEFDPSARAADHDFEDDAEDGEENGPEFEREFDADSFDWTFSFLKGDAREARPATPLELAKDRYRRLVRLLHPDVRPARDAWADELWHMAQAAHRDKDGARLEALLALARLRFGEGSERPLISEALSAAEWLRGALKRLSAETRIAQKDDAWGFSKLKDRTRLERKIAYQLEDDLEEMRLELARYEAFVDKCARPPRPRPRQAKRR